MKTLSKEARRHWLILKLTPFMGVATINKITKQLPIEALFSMSSTKLSKLKLKDASIKALTQPDLAKVEYLEQWADEPNQQILCYGHEGYPKSLTQIASPPEVLFIKGDSQLLNAPQLAIVGSRNVTIGGQETAFTFAKQLATLGITVTSGLAVGVDGHAHRGAIQGQGKTIAVLGTGLEQIYPKRHQQLAQQICQSGALVSEFLPQQAAKAEHFPRRNRIVSGLTKGTLVVEAAVKSGSLITARYALEQNREVFAVPGSIHNPMSEGCHQLIKQGAKLVESIHDIIEEIGEFQQFLAKQSIENQATQPNNQDMADSFLACIGYDVTSVDTIAERSNLPVPDVLARLLDMEIEGKITAIAGGYTRI